jgi:hypothetical protein
LGFGSVSSFAYENKTVYKTFGKTSQKRWQKKELRKIISFSFTSLLLHAAKTVLGFGRLFSFHVDWLKEIMKDFNFLGT